MKRLIEAAPYIGFILFMAFIFTVSSLMIGMGLLHQYKILNMSCNCEEVQK